MTKEEALELLKNSPLMEPVVEEYDGEICRRYIGEYIGETDTNFCWVVYWPPENDPNDRTYAFLYHVNKETKEVSHAGAPLLEKELKDIQERSKL